jgi:glutamate-1-semialdehyde 2,1-aminomutase
MPLRTPVDRNTLQSLLEKESRYFADRHPVSAGLAEQAREHLYRGVPMHWMADWSTPYPLFVREASEARFRDVDGHEYADFCLGDTGAMFGHSPGPVAEAVREQSCHGYTTMLPGEDAIAVGRELSRRFGLPFWQVTTTATDANRSALRWARAATGRSTILVFDGCYHGTVDETMIRLRGGRSAHRAGLLGQAQDLTAHTRVVEFNDLAALEQALGRDDVAAVLCEPVMTNIGMVLPEPGFHLGLRKLTRRHGSLLIIDETHTISTGIGGYTACHGLEPDIFVLGKPVAGGLPCAVFGVSEHVALAMDEARGRAAASGEHGHSGMGTTLSGNAFTMHAMRANLEQVMTESAYGSMIPRAENLAAKLATLFRQAEVPWSITQIGARIEFQFCPKPPRTGREAEAAFDTLLEQTIHLYLLNRGIMITPFHNMMLVCPQTRDEDVDKLVAKLAQCLEELGNQ